MPHRPVTVQTPLAPCAGTVVDGDVRLQAVRILRAGLGLWQGAQTVLPTARMAHLGLSRDEATREAHCYLDTLPATIGAQVGVLVFDPMLATAGSLIQVLERLEQRGVGGDRLRVITALAASPVLQRLADRFPQLTIYTG